MKKEIHKQYLKAMVFTILPFLIPFIFEVEERWINKLAQHIIVFLLIIIDIIFVIFYTRREAILKFKSREISLDNKKYRISQKVLNRISNCEKIKGAYIKDETYHVQYIYKENILLYNPHRYLERVCDELKSLISDITDIDLEYVSVSFIYKYPIYSKDKMKGWKWITGKESTSDLELENLIKNPHSFYHYIISNNVATLFENNKEKLIPNRYWKSEKDDRYNIFGSISSHRISFLNNNETFCTGYLIISTYGKNFIQNIIKKFLIQRMNLNKFCMI